MIRILKAIWVALVFLVTGRRPRPACDHLWRVVATSEIPKVLANGASSALEARQALAPMTRISFMCERCLGAEHRDRCGVFTMDDFYPKKNGSS